MENRTIKLEKNSENQKQWLTTQIDINRVVRENEKSILVKLPAGFVWFSKKLCTKLEILNRVSIRYIANEQYKVYDNINGPWDNPNMILGAALLESRKK